MKTSNKILIMLGIGLVAFSILMIITFFVKDSIPDTLVTCVFASCTGEFSILGWIKTTKEKNRCSNIENSDIGDIGDDEVIDDEITEQSL